MRGSTNLRTLVPPLIRHFVTSSPRERGEGKECLFLVLRQPVLLFLGQEGRPFVGDRPWPCFWPSSTSWKFLIATWSTKLPRFSRCVGGVTISYFDASFSSVEPALELLGLEVRHPGRRRCGSADADFLRPFQIVLRRQKRRHQLPGVVLVLRSWRTSPSRHNRASDRTCRSARPASAPPRNRRRSSCRRCRAARPDPG